MLPRMVTRTRLRAVLTALGLYTVAALIIGYFGLSAYTGAHGLKAKQDLAQQQANLMRELERVTAERKQWEHRVSLLRADKLDPDLLDERARAMLNYAASARPDADRSRSSARRFAALRAAAGAGRDKILWQCKTLRLRCALPCARFRAPPISAMGRQTSARSVPGRSMAVAKTKPASKPEAKPGANASKSRRTRTPSRSSPRSRNFPPIARCC